jgi:hypothetical protein
LFSFMLALALLGGCTFCRGVHHGLLLLLPRSEIFSYHGFI